MPRFSIFTPLGHLKFSSAKPLGEQFFDVGRSALGKAYKVERGSRAFAWLYAWAMALATLRMRVERAGRQWDPRRVYEYLDDHERDRGVSPRAGQTVIERRAELEWRRKLLPAPTRANIENMLRERLGDAFLAFVPTSKADAVSYPETELLGDGPVLFRRQTDRRAAAKTTGAIMPGAPAFLGYERLAAGVEYLLRPRDRVLVGVNTDQAEVVEVLNETADDDGNRFVQIETANPHTAGETIALVPFPYWVSTKRHSLVVLTAEGAEDPEKRRLAHEVLERLMRGVSTWDITAANDDAVSAGPFRVGGGKLGLTPIGLIPL